MEDNRHWQVHTPLTTVMEMFAFQVNVGSEETERERERERETKMLEDCVMMI